jgi:hypothetical protein
MHNKRDTTQVQMILAQMTKEGIQPNEETEYSCY